MKCKIDMTHVTCIGSVNMVPDVADGAHAGICLETPEPINAALVEIIKLQDLKQARKEMVV